MTEIRPFQAVIYNPQKIKNLAKVTCPPYDIISPQRQEYYSALDPHNLIHILLGKDTPGQDKYRQAATYFKGWLKEEIFIQDQEPAIYFYSQQYRLKGEKKIRTGFIALLNLGEKKSSVFGHEHTQLAPKEDRFRLLKAVKANLSPIFVIFPDRQRLVSRTFQETVQARAPFIDFLDEEKIAHKVWRLTDQKMLADIQLKMQREDIFIADGHHRYEVAYRYRDLMRQKASQPSDQEDFDYIMAYFTPTDSPGLVVLPIHRLVKVGANFDLENFIKSCSEFFDFEQIKDRIKFFFMLEKAGCTQNIFGMYKDQKYWLIRLKNIKILERIISDKPPEFRRLDAAILNYIVFEKILGLSWDDRETITYSHETEEVLRKADEDSAYVVFLLNPVKIKQITTVALNRQKLPAKSTYFYPKVLSGLVINKFN